MISEASVRSITGTAGRTLIGFSSSESLSLVCEPGPGRAMEGGGSGGAISWARRISVKIGQRPNVCEGSSDSPIDVYYDGYPRKKIASLRIEVGFN